MASAVKDAVQETIDIIDQLGGKRKKRGISAWLVIPVALVVVFSAFMVIRRFFAPGDEF